MSSRRDPRQDSRSAGHQIPDPYTIDNTNASAHQSRHASVHSRGGPMALVRTGSSPEHTSRAYDHRPSDSGGEESSEGESDDESPDDKKKPGSVTVHGDRFRNSNNNTRFSPAANRVVEPKIRFGGKVSINANIVVLSNGASQNMTGEKEGEEEGAECRGGGQRGGAADSRGQYR